MTSIGDWTVKVTGEVVRVNRQDIDKSGKNPRYLYTFVVRPSDLDGVPAGAEVSPEMAIRVHAGDLDALTKQAPKAGDRVVMTAKASGARPRTFHLTALG